MGDGYCKYGASWVLVCWVWPRYGCCGDGISRLRLVGRISVVVEEDGQTVGRCGPVDGDAGDQVTY